MATATPTNPNKPITPGGWVRLGLYAVAVLAGLASVLADPLGFGGLTELLMSISGMLLVATGGTAALNLGKADDQQLKIRDLIPAVGNVVTEVRGLRERQPREVADEVEKRVKPKPAPAPAQEPATGSALLADMRDRIAQQRG